MRPSLAFLFLVLPFAAGAQTPPPALPQFEGYPAPAAYQGRLADVDLASSPRARTFRTRLREGVAGGPNFAGHFALVEWGCGSGCQAGAIVDVRTGRVYDLPEATGFGTSYRLDSRLLVLNPPEVVFEVVGPDGDIPEWGGKSAYYVWEDGGFRHLRTLTSSDLAQLRHGGAPTAPSMRGASDVLVPLAVGNEWNYERARGSYSERISVVGIQRRAGVEWYRIRRDFRSPTTSTSTFLLWRNDSSGFHTYHIEDDFAQDYMYSYGRAATDEMWSAVSEEAFSLTGRSHTAICYTGEDGETSSGICFVPGIGMVAEGFGNNLSDFAGSQRLTGYHLNN